MSEEAPVKLEYSMTISKALMTTLCESWLKHKSDMSVLVPNETKERTVEIRFYSEVVEEQK